MTNKYFIVAFLFGLNLWSAMGTAAPNSLIGKACHGLGSFEQFCHKTLESAPKNQKGDANSLALYTLGLFESTLSQLSTSFKTFSKVDSSAPPQLKEAMNNCVKEYAPVDSLVKDAIKSVSAKAYPEAEKNINKAINKMDRCDKSFNPDLLKKSKESEMIISGFKKSNADLKNFLSVAQNILKASK